MTTRARFTGLLLILFFCLPLVAAATSFDAPAEQRAFFDVERLPNGVRARVSLATLTDSTQISALIASPSGQGVSASLLSADGVEVIVTEPLVIRGIKVYPIQLRSVGGQSFDSNQIVEFEAEFTDNVLDAINDPIPVSAELERMLRRSVLNGDDLDLETVAPVGRLLIIVEDNEEVVNALDPYIQWKRQQGYRITVAHPEDNTEPYAIRTLISDEYFSDNPYPLEYVLLVGDHDDASDIQMVGYKYDNEFMGNETDNWFVTLEGRLPVPDVAIGRFSVRDIYDLRVGVNKTLKYERDGDLHIADWIEHAALTAGSTSGISVLETNRAVRWMFDERGIAVDSLWWTMPGGGLIPQFIQDQINLGVGYVNYRGYYGMSGWHNGMLNGLNNVNQLPVVVTITCGTGMWAIEDEAISEGFFRAGTINEPLGAVACIGTGTTDTHTRFNNVVDGGVFEALLMNNVRSLGWCLVNGKTRLAEAYNNTTDSHWIIRFANWNNLIGDPALRLWLNAPVDPTVIHEPNLRLGSNHVDVNITLPGEWPELVWATIANEDRVIDSRRIRSDGDLRLHIDEMSADDTITLTVVGDDVTPYQAVLPIVGNDQDLAVSNVIVDDGNDDLANPGETLTLDIELHNFAGTGIGSGTATVNSTDPRIDSIAASTFDYPAIAAGQTFVVEDAVTLTVSGWAPDGCMPALTATFSGGIDSAIPFEVFAWEFTCETEYAWTDSTLDRRIFPGETGNIAIPVKNHGRADAVDLTANLYFSDERVTVLNNPLSFVDVGSDSLRNNLQLPFQVQLSEETLVGEFIPFVVEFADGSGCVDSVHAQLIPGDPRVAGGTGPDPVVGYWAIDDTDIELIRPEYEWFDNINGINNTGLEDNWSGGAYNYGEEDDSIVMNLPFPFMYYGQVFTEVTINTNGWIALGDRSSIILFRNWPIPNPMGPPAMVAPFWDDLHTGESGVYASYDIETDRFVVTWDCLAASNGTPQVFQVILYGPMVYPTQSGNGRIAFQYQDVSVVTGNGTDNDFITVGIESPDQQSGIEYQYWNFLRAGAEPIQSGRAILFTDDFNWTAVYSEGSVYPDEVSAELIGAQEIEVPVYIENVGEENLVWVADAQEGTMPDEDATNTYGPNPGLFDKNGRSISSVSPSDTYGYFWMDAFEPGAEYDWLVMPDATVLTEDDLHIGTLDDGYFKGIEIPFVWEFYGSYYDSVYVSPNGFLVFQNDLHLDYGTEQNRIVPSTWAPNRYNPAAMVSTWWDDFDLTEGGEISVWTGVEDSLLVTWSGMMAGTHPGGPYTFQALLLKSGFIKMQYQDMDEDWLISSTIGIQNHDATHGLQILCQQPFMEDGLSLLIGYDSHWIAPASDYGVLAPGEIDTATVLVHSYNLDMGTYEGYISVRMNDADNQIWHIPMSVTVTGAGSTPEISDVEDVHIPFGYEFEPFLLDDYVTDEIWGSQRIRWTVTGNDELSVHVFDRQLHVEKPNGFWQGAETVYLTATNPEGNWDDTSLTISIGDVSVDEHNRGLPTEFAVGNLYPNPFNPSVALDVALPTASPVTLEVFDILGRMVDRISLPLQNAGYHRFSWDGTGKPSGVYFIQVAAAGKMEVRKAVLMK
jgi:Peptidase family C25/FlgD Ig-like domain